MSIQDYNKANASAIKMAVGESFVLPVADAAHTILSRLNANIRDKTFVGARDKLGKGYRIWRKS